MKNRPIKSVLFVLVAAIMLFVAACTPKSPDDPSVTGKTVELELCTYPVGGWGNPETVSSLLSSFHRQNRHINVSVTVVDYTTGDSEVEKAISEGHAPDLVFEGPERLVANWGDRNLMADLSDLWQDEISGQISEPVRVACHDGRSKHYIYPVCMTTHCMAINRDMFEAAGALRYIDEETHTWTTDGFISAVEALYEKRAELGIDDVAAVFCKDQGGDQGTRALVNNLYGGKFTNPEHTRFTVDSDENIMALELLKNLDGINFDPTLVGSEEISKFCNKKLAMAFCWNVSGEVNLARDYGSPFDALPMAFPTSEGDPQLQGGIWGFGVFDNGDPDKIAAAKTLIRFMTGDDDTYTRAVLASGYWPVRDVVDPYANDPVMSEYSVFGKYLGDFYQVTPGWADARTAWWKMLQSIGTSTDDQSIDDAVAAFSSAVNPA